MKNKITKQIEAGYGDLRKSEKQAADYILAHMEEAAELSLGPAGSLRGGESAYCFKNAPGARL